MQCRSLNSRFVDRYQTNGEDVEDALEAVVIAQRDEAAQEYVDATPDQEEIPFDDTPVQPQPRQAGEVAPTAIEEAARQARIEEEDAEGRAEPVPPGEVEGEEGVTPARRVTPQVAAIPGMTPLGVTPAAPVEVEDHFSTPAGGAFLAGTDGASGQLSHM